MNYPQLQSNGFDYTATALSALRRIPRPLRASLQRSGDWEDVAAWAFVAAWEGYVNRWNRKEVYNAAQRYIYRALKAIGYKRVKNQYVLTELSYTIAEELLLLGETSKKED